MPWYVVYTKARNEKQLTKQLTAKGIKVYCPLRDEIRQWSDRKKKIAEPVFKSYIFVFLDDYTTQHTQVLMTSGAVRFIWWNKKPGIVREEEIAAINNFLTDYKDVAIDFEVAEGQAVTILEGPLKENRGIVSHVKGNKAYLILHILGMNLTATVPVQSIKPDN